MNRKLLIVIGIGLLGASASTYLFYHLLSNNLQEKKEQAAAAVSVVVAARDLPRGTELTIDDLRVTEWSGPQLPGGAFQEPKALVGQRLKRNVRYSEAVAQSALMGQDDSWLASMIPTGMRGVTVHVAEFAGVTQHLEVGDRVDVLVADGPQSPGNRELHLRTILQNVEVLTTGREPLTETRQSPIAAVTLLVEAKDSETLNLADQSGSIRLALRNPLDESTATTRGGKLSDVMAGRDRAASNARPAEAQASGGAAAPAAAASANPSVERDRTPRSPESPRLGALAARNE
jgi:pilus assembly protein CpaB